MFQCGMNTQKKPTTYKKEKKNGGGWQIQFQLLYKDL